MTSAAIWTNDAIMFFWNAWPSPPLVKSPILIHPLNSCFSAISLEESKNTAFTIRSRYAKATVSTWFCSLLKSLLSKFAANILIGYCRQ